MFKVGDLVQAKMEYLEPGETQESTMGVVLEYYESNKYLVLGVLNPNDYAIPPRFERWGGYYEKVEV